MFTHTISRSYKDSSLGTITGQEVAVFDAEANFDGSITGSATDAEVDWAVTVSKLKTLSIWSDKSVTIKTNSSGAPQETIAIAAGYNMIWTLAMDGAPKIPLGGNVTKLYITNNDTAAATVKIRALLDLHV